jgi:pantoate kinase
MKAKAFSPGHITGFFEPVYYKNYDKTGSRGAGISVNLGALSEVSVKNSNKQIFEIFINNKKSNSHVINLALKNFLGEKTFHVIVNTKLDLPYGQGFGMSAASALSATYALAEILNLSKIEAIKASHHAEIYLKTGLGDVIASCYGGIEIRKEPGIPPWGIIEKIPGKFNLVLCIVDDKIDTKKILTDNLKQRDIINSGKYCTLKLLESPSVNNLFLLSKIFTEKTKLANDKVKKAIESIDEFGMASMCMIGNSIFAFGNIKKISKELNSFGKLYVCSIDNKGARVINY